MRITKTKEERRLELIDIAFQLFSTNKFDEVKVSDIVAKAQVAQGTFYYYFKTKEDIVAAIISEHMEQMVGYLNVIADTRTVPVEKRLEQIMFLLTRPGHIEDPFMQLMSQLDEKMHLEVDQMRNQRLFPIIDRLCIEGMEKKLFRIYSYPHQAIKILFEGISAALHKPESHHEVVRSIEELINTVLGTELKLSDHNESN